MSVVAAVSAGAGSKRGRWGFCSVRCCCTFAWPASPTRCNFVYFVQRCKPCDEGSSGQTAAANANANAIPIEPGGSPQCRSSMSTICCCVKARRGGALGAVVLRDVCSGTLVLWLHMLAVAVAANSSMMAAVLGCVLCFEPPLLHRRSAQQIGNVK